MIDEILVLNLGDELKYSGDSTTLSLSLIPGIYRLECFVHNASLNGYMHVKMNNEFLSYFIYPGDLSTSYTVSSDEQCLEFSVIRGIWDIACFTIITHVLF